MRIVFVIGAFLSCVAAAGCQKPAGTAPAPTAQTEGVRPSASAANPTNADDARTRLLSCCKQCIAITKVLGEVFGDRVPVNLDLLIAGSLLADVGKMLEFDKDAAGNVIKGFYGDMLRHPFSGVALCFKHGIPPEVMHIVATHSHEGDKVERTIESWIFHHADFIDFDIAKVLGKKAAK